MILFFLSGGGVGVVGVPRPPSSSAELEILLPLPLPCLSLIFFFCRSASAFRSSSFFLSLFLFPSRSLVLLSASRISRLFRTKARAIDLIFIRMSGEEFDASPSDKTTHRISPPGVLSLLTGSISKAFRRLSSFSSLILSNDISYSAPSLLRALFVFDSETFFFRDAKAREELHTAKEEEEEDGVCLFFVFFFEEEKLL